MKTRRRLFDQIVAFDNLLMSFHLACRGKRDRPEVADFEFRLDRNLIALREELLDGSYRPGPYRNFYIRDPKRRLISAAPFRDRVVHHALCRVIEPPFERRFIFDSYACRVGKGTHAALDRCQQFARRYPYVLQCDLEHFFPRVDHALLLAALGRVIADRRALDLCALILAGGRGLHDADCEPAWFAGDDLLAALLPRGLPIGNLTSQFWANVYLDAFDQFVKRELKCPAYVRYVDDFLLFASDKASLHRWRAEVISFLAGLRMRVHEERAAVFPVATGIPFLGWRLYPDHRRLRRRNGVAFQRRLWEMKRRVAQGRMSAADMRVRMQSWIAHAQHGQTCGLRRALLNRPPRNLRREVRT